MAAVAVAGCGGSQKSGGTPVSAQEFPARFASAWCSLIKGCCEASGGASDAACAAAIETEVKGRGELAAADGATWDATVAGRCLASLGKTDCAVDGSGLFEVVTLCDDVWKGVVPPGGACQTYASCAELPAHADAVAGASCVSGMCVPIVQQPLGETCDDETFVCDLFRATCSVATPHTCVPRPGPNENCLLVCRDGSECQDGVCVPLAALGAACAADADCASGTCSGGKCASLIAAAFDDHCALP